MNVPFVDLRAQHASINVDVETACLAVLKRGDFILGDEVAEFEREFAEYCGVEHCVGVDSGLSALEMTLRACDIGPGDEVITAANTFIATALAITASGATPILVDHDLDTYCIDPLQIESAITSRTRAIVPVHLYGHLAEMQAISAIAKRHGLFVIEDAAQAHGARLGGRRAGAFGDAAAFSFYPAKNLGAAGDGGAVVTSRPEIAERVRLLGNYGQRTKNEHAILGENHRLDTLQAAILRVKLRHLEEWNARRRDHAGRYDHLLAHVDVERPTASVEVDHVWHLYVIRVQDRERVRERLARRGISTGLHYPVPLYRQGAYRGSFESPHFPNTERCAPELLSLPMFAELEEQQLERVVSELAAVLSASASRL